MRNKGKFFARWSSAVIGLLKVNATLIGSRRRRRQLAANGEGRQLPLAANGNRDVAIAA